MMRRLILALAIMIMMSACAFNAPKNTPAPVEPAPPSDIPTEIPTEEVLPTDTAVPPPTQPPAEPSAPQAVYGPHDFPPDVSPLIGKTVQNQSLLERRPLAVKVQLFPRGGRPPYGVSLADIVYDYYQNFGLTRLHAIFLSQDAQTVGPIRSARLLDQQLISMYQSVFAFGSAEARTFSRLTNSDFAGRLVVEGSANCPPMCREDPNGSNKLVTNTAELSKYATDKGMDNVRQNLDGMYFNPGTPPNGKPATQIFVRFSISAYTLWDYNPETGRYLRYQDTQEAQDSSLESTEALIDQLTNAQIAADNVVVLSVPHSYAFGTKPGVNEVIDINLTGSGPAFAFRDGQMFEAVWNRADKNSVLFLTLPDGTYYSYKPGTTWYEVIGSTSKTTMPNPNMYRFDHNTP